MSGRIAYAVVTGDPVRLHTIWIANVDGTGAHQVLEGASWPALSPDGKRIAFFLLPGGGKSEGLYVANSDGGNLVPVFISPGACCANWSRDGNWIVFADSAKPRQPGGPISMVKVDNIFKTVIGLKVVGNGPAFSPDGTRIVYSGCLPSTNTCGVLTVPTDGSGAAKAVTQDSGGNAHWSPDGKKIVYQATGSGGHLEVFTINADGSGKKQLTSGTSNDGQPIWSRDGGSIFWLSDQNGTGWAIYVMNADGSNKRRILTNVTPDPVLWGWVSMSLAP